LIERYQTILESAIPSSLSEAVSESCSPLARRELLGLGVRADQIVDATGEFKFKFYVARH
jgi:hypothetical protein